MKKLISILLLLAVAALGFVVIRQQREVARLQKAATEKEAAAPAAAPISPAAPSREAAMEPPGAPLPPPALAARIPSPPPVAAPAGRKSPASMFASMGAMMTNPAMKEMVRAQTQAQLNMQYEYLYGYLNQSPESLAALKQLLLDRQMALTEFAMALMSAEGTEEERQQRVDALEQIKKSFERQIADLLGHEEFDVFQQYENTQSERTQIEMFKRTIASSPEPLTDRQENDLVLALYEARTNFALSQFTQNNPVDPSQFTREKLTETFSQMEQLQSRYAEAASKILSLAQFTQYQQFMAQQKDLNALGMKMAEQMFGLGEPAAPPDPAQP